MGKVTIIGIDLARNVLQPHGAAADGSVVFRKKMSLDTWGGEHPGQALRPRFRDEHLAAPARGEGLSAAQRSALAIALAALALTIVFAEYITRRIASSLATLMALSAISGAGAAQPAGEDDRDEVKALARTLGGMSRHIATLHAEMDRTGRELEGLAAELAAASRGLGAGDEALATTAAMQQEMLDRLKARSR